jgi:hypothetical protein
VLAAVAAVALVAFLDRGRWARTASVAIVGIVLMSNSIASTVLARHQSERVFRSIGARGWVDGRLGPDARIAVLATENVDWMLLWQTEFWNRSVQLVYYVGPREPGTLPTRRVTIDERTGRLVRDDGAPLGMDGIVTDRTVELDAPLIHELPNGLRLYAVAGETAARSILTGLYPDSWTGPTLTYTRPGCRGTTRLIFAFDSDERYAPGPQTVVARQGSEELARETVQPGKRLALRVPLDRARGSCTLALEITPTWVPASKDGSAEPRELGLVFRAVVNFDEVAG